MMNIDFTDKTALITGATRGIGKAIAEKLHNSGARLLLTGTDHKTVQSMNEECQRKNIKTIEYLQADFSNKKSTDYFLVKIKDYEKIDICINNAGVNKIDQFIDTTDNDYKWIHDINLLGPYRILKEIGKKMIHNNYGRVLNISSIWSIVTKQGRSLYTSSKYGLVGLTKTLSVEWAQHNILVNSLSPGFTRTELTERTNTPEQLQQIAEIIPLKRLASPEEIAIAAAFLCCDLNSYITGQNIIIDGGFTNV